jgi:hypothetical protein
VLNAIELIAAYAHSALAVSQKGIKNPKKTAKPGACDDTTRGGVASGLEMAQRQGTAGLDLAQRKAGVQVFDMGQVDQALARKA